MEAPSSTPGGGSVSRTIPDSSPDLGNTVITVMGNGFSKKQDLRCNFGQRNVPAEYVTGQKVECTAPQFKLNPSESGQKIKFWLSGGGEISNSVDFLFHATLLVSDAANDCVHAFDSYHGHFVKTLVSSGAGGLKDPQGISFGADMNIYVASGASNQILKYNANGQSMGVFSELPANCGPKDIEFGPDGNLFVACSALSKVLAFNANSGQQLGVAAQGGGLSQPQGIAFGPGNSLYVMSHGTRQVLRYAQGGYFQGAVHRLEDHGADVAFAEGQVFVTGGAHHNHAVCTIKDGQMHAYAQSFSLRDPVGIVFDPAGYLMVASGDNVIRFTAGGHSLNTMKPFRINMKATYMAVSPREKASRRGVRDEL